MGWFSRRDQNDMEQIARLSAENVRLSERVAYQASTIDNITMLLNSIQAERQALAQRMLDVSYPIQIYARQGEVPARPVEVHGRPVDDGSAFVIPPHLKDAMPRPPARAGSVPPQSAEDVMANSISAQQVSTTSFEDPGDDVARAAGIDHDALGNVAYSR